ncbi:MAG TPA: bifunctional glutamate N-acetyltransferase/amino-acid acetyltransferase ArgJ [Ktedonobacteraceae bacterium]
MQALAHSPRGFRSSVKNVGIRDNTLDFTVIVSDVPAAGAAMFTQSRFCGAAIVVGREHVADGKLQAFVINSKNANVATGERGLANIREIVQLVANELHIDPRDILPSSTGVIGWQLPMEKMRAGIVDLGQQLQEGQLHICAQGIMTTDTHPKIGVRRVGDAVLVGMAKGVGMIEPNMATMLSYFVTDAQIPAETLKQMLKEVVDLSFNCLSVDTDTSTSDTVAIMANGQAGPVPLDEFRAAFQDLAIELTKTLARDGEGATRLLEVTVGGASTPAQAKRVAKAILNSPLVKTAVFGADPNWGRVAMAIGKCEEQTDILPENVTIAFGELVVYQGQPLEMERLPELKTYLQGSEVAIQVSLGLGKSSATVWGCDLSYEYVRINGEYTS